MATLGHIRGALLEEAVLFLLQKVGYSTVDHSQLETNPIPGLRAGRAGLEAQGRGTWHQLDALSTWTHSPPFVYPIRLILEAKCYAHHSPVQLATVRNAVGVLKDIAENYFSFTRAEDDIVGPRFNYVAAFFLQQNFQHLPLITPLLIRSFSCNTVM